MKHLIGWTVSALALFFIGKIIFDQWETVAANLRHINGELLIYGILSFLSYFFLRSYLWQTILKEHGHKIPLKETAFFWAISEMSRYIPGNIWALVKRSMLFSKNAIEKKDFGSALIIEAQFVLLGASFISLFALDLIADTFVYPSAFRPLAKLAVSIFVILLTGLYIFQSDFLVRFKQKQGRSGTYLAKFSSLTQLRIALISVLAFFLYGLGYYFSISSLIFLHPKDIFIFAGFFTFSLLAGYLSFITPAGLGVREGVIVLGLIKYVALPLAAFVAIFTRIILILSELAFVVLAFLWHRASSRELKKIESTISYYPYEAILTIATIVYMLYFAQASFLRYDNFYAGRFDLGNMAQTVWNTAHGRLFQTNTDGQIVSRLSAHADFLLILLAPLYSFWESPKVLLLFQTAAVAIGAFFVFAIAKHILKRKDISLLFAMLYLINPSVERANLYDFHAITIGTTLLLGTYYFFVKRSYVRFLLLAILAAITKEEIWIIIALFGLWLMFAEAFRLLRKKNYRLTKGLFFGCLIYLCSFLMFVFLFFYAIPNARGGPHFALSYYSDYGDSPSKIIRNIVFSPLQTMETIFKPDQVDFITQLFLPLSFLPFFAPLYLVFAVPDLLITLLSNNANLHQVYYHYTASITPFLFIAAIYGIKRFNAILLPSHRVIVMIIIGCVGIYGAYAYGPLPGSKDPNLDMLTKQVSNRETIEAFLKKIPSAYSVAASNNVGAHLSHREKIFTIPDGMDKVDIIVFLLNDPGARPSLDAQKQMALHLASDPNYIPLFENCDFIAFARKNRIHDRFW